MMFSIIIPVHNRSHLLPPTIQSALAQNYPDFEVIVVDDGSTENIEAVVKSFNNDKIVFHKQPAKERGAARNTGVRLARGEYICFLDSDDLLYPHHLQEAATWIEKLHQPEVLTCNFNIKQNDKIILEKGYDTNLKTLNRELVTFGNVICTSGIFLRKDIINKHPFSEELALSGSEDYELWLRLACLYTIYCSPEVTSTLIEHEDRSVLTMNVEKLVKRQLLFLECVFRNPDFKSSFPNAFPYQKYQAYSYISLHLALAKQAKTTAWQYLFLALMAYPKGFFRKRTFATLKRLIF